MVKNPLEGDIRDTVRSLRQEDPLEEDMATPSSILSWRVPWMEDGPWGCKESDVTEAPWHTHTH